MPSSPCCFSQQRETRLTSIRALLLGEPEQEKGKMDLARKQGVLELKIGREESAG